MAECIIPMSSVTYAEKAKRAAFSLGMDGDIVNIDPAVTKRGCAYGLRLPCGDAERLMGLLERRGIPYGEMMGALPGREEGRRSRRKERGASWEKN